MATTYNVTIIELLGAPSLEGATNVVTSVSYNIQGIADDGTEVIHGDGISCTYDADNFTPFDDLTEEQINEIRGPKGEKGDKGDKGDKLIWEDLTEENIEQNI